MDKQLLFLFETIADGRSIDGKKYNKYLVINIDEPYAPEIGKF